MGIITNIARGLGYSPTRHVPVFEIEEEMAIIPTVIIPPPRIVERQVITIDRESPFTQMDVWGHENARGRDHEDYTALQATFATESDVYSSADTVAGYGASTPFAIRRYARGDAFEDITDHDLIAILDHPNPDHTGYELFHALIRDLIATGNAYMGFQLGSELWRVNPNYMKVRPDQRGYIDGFMYGVAGKEQLMGKDEVVHIRLGTDPRPGKHYYGLGPLASLALNVATAISANTHNYNMLNKGPAWMGYLQHKQEAGMPGLTPDQIKQAKEKFTAQAGGVQNHGDIMILSNMEWKDINARFSDMDFEALGKFTREQVITAIGGSGVLQGLLDGATYANSSEQIKIFLDKVHQKYLMFIESGFSRFFQANGILKPNEYVNYDLTARKIESQPMSERSESGFKLHTSGIFSRDETRRKFFMLPPGAGEDYFLIPKNYVPVSAITGKPIEGMMPEPPAPVINPLADKAKLPDDPTRMIDAALEYVRMATTPDFLAQRDEWMRVMRGVASQYFRDEITRIEAAVEMAWPTQDIRAIYDVQRAKGRIDEAFGQTMIAMAAHFADIPIGVSRAVDYPPELLDASPELRQSIIDMITNVHHVPETTASDLAGIIYDGYVKQVSLDDIIAQIGDAFEDWPMGRADLVAQTVTTGLSSAGAELQAKGDGMTHKTWRDNNDSLVRDSHSSIDGETIPIEGTFSNGVRYPGDPLGPTAETIFCRCWLEYS